MNSFSINQIYKIFYLRVEWGVEGINGLSFYVCFITATDMLQACMNSAILTSQPSAI